MQGEKGVGGTSPLIKLGAIRGQFRVGNEMSHLRKSVSDCKNNCLTLRGRQICDDVQQDVHLACLELKFKSHEYIF